ncbi:MAG: type II secretion system F family protein [Nanoarchaeota archaeon]
MTFFEEVGKAVLPERFRPHLREYFRKAGHNEAPYDLFGTLFFVSIGLTVLTFVFFIYPWVIDRFFNPITQLILIFVFFALINFALATLFGLIIYFSYDIIIFNRTQKLEAVLPDFLEMVSTNLRGGMSFEQSLWAAITPEFSVLADEISLTAKKVLTGTDLEYALKELAEKYDSDMLKRTMSIIIGEVSSGGKIAEILDRITLNMKETRKLKREMTTSVLSYIIFVAVVVMVISPALFALSFNIMDIISEFSNRLAAASQSGSIGGLAVNFTIIRPDAQGFMTFSVLAIILIAVCSSVIVAMLEKGSIRSGIKYIPIFVGTSVGFYFLFFGILKAVFSTLF